MEWLRFKKITKLKLDLKVWSRFGEAELSSWVGETPEGGEGMDEDEPDLPAWCNKVNMKEINHDLKTNLIVNSA